MNTALKVLLIVVGTVLALILVASLAFKFLFDANAYRSHISAQVESATGRKLEIERLQVSLFPVIGARIRNARLDNAPGFGDQPMAQVGEVQVSLRLLPMILHHRVRIGRITLKDAQLNLVRRADGRGNWEGLGEKAAKPGRSGTPPPAPNPAPNPAQPGAADFEIAGIDIDNAAVGFDDQQARKKYSVSAFNLKTGTLSASASTDVKLGFSTALSDPQIAAVVSLAVHVVPDLAAHKLDLQHLELSVNASGAGLAAGKQDLALTADAHFDAAQKSMAVSNLVIKTDSGTITGDLAVAGENAPVKFALKADRLDLDRFLPPRPQARGTLAPASPPAPGSAGEKPLPFDALDQLNASGTVDIGLLTVKGLRLADVHLVLDAARGAEKHASERLALYGGTLAADTRIDSGKRPQIAQSAKLAGVNIGPLMNDFQGRDSVSGVLDTTLAVTGGGASLAEIRHALNGTVSLSLRNGAIRGFNLAQLMRQGQAMQQGQPFNGGADAQTDFTAIAATGTIKDGVLHSEDLRGESPLLRIQGSGDVDLGNATVDYLAKPALVNTATGQGGRPLADLQTVIVPIRISGPLAAPQYRLDMGEAVKQKVIDKLGDRNGGLVEQIQNLFGKKKQP